MTACSACKQVVENRLFSEGLHVLGRAPSREQLGQYLSAFFDEGLSPQAVEAVVQARGDGLAAVKCASASAEIHSECACPLQGQPNCSFSSKNSGKPRRVP